ncbi:uncharacterized protein AMSG_00549 [Thecamonas trahens ATCC 50062]|uniref:Uncharacterized protein n=1 Tax=Thecamonas trahens ATCC 50062 TaxID=461836 RepID=A0A0L0D8R6_THETB|nr:hypothetical protein AMSG_00549 [Thecamonas trahens ATCC 50062]KNC48772.1 hypothetical protein AMSG_00549 [Thecamonas trahens ATCC 50062]|eukprot:XP_013762823.1 hypothetical protein AMSG_00549 [Thecamonas trahens ATCC 50062]
MPSVPTPFAIPHAAPLAELATNAAYLLHPACHAYALALAEWALGRVSADGDDADSPLSEASSGVFSPALVADALVAWHPPFAAALAELDGGNERAARLLGAPLRLERDLAVAASDDGLGNLAGGLLVHAANTTQAALYAPLKTAGVLKFLGSVTDIDSAFLDEWRAAPPELLRHGLWIKSNGSPRIILALRDALVWLAPPESSSSLRKMRHGLNKLKSSFKKLGTLTAGLTASGPSGPGEYAIQNLPGLPYVLNGPPIPFSLAPLFRYVIPYTAIDAIRASPSDDTAFDIICTPLAAHTAAKKKKPKATKHSFSVASPVVRTEWLWLLQDLWHAALAPRQPAVDGLDPAVRPQSLILASLWLHHARSSPAVASVIATDPVSDSDADSDSDSDPLPATSPPSAPPAASLTVDSLHLPDDDEVSFNAVTAPNTSSDNDDDDELALLH